MVSTCMGIRAPEHAAEINGRSRGNIIPRHEATGNLNYSEFAHAQFGRVAAVHDRRKLREKPIARERVAC